MLEKHELTATDRYWLNERLINRRYSLTLRQVKHLETLIAKYIDGTTVGKHEFATECGICKLIKPKDDNCWFIELNGKRIGGGLSKKDGYNMLLWITMGLGDLAEALNTIPPEGHTTVGILDYETEEQRKDRELPF